MNLGWLLVESAASGLWKAVPSLWKYSRPKYKLGSKKGSWYSVYLKPNNPQFNLFLCGSHAPKLQNSLFVEDYIRNVNLWCF